ncbi:hypothetical protein [Dolosicoccus paucivorans]|uniref:hypothetical protein n=1 Tax=Dolosicoccus paucivorans TaxID=84521 RepID=UPI00088154DE|nr:hypothetical protein [Dolosicoccus paucivorans]SDI41082.1 hypothetical protein SAMN04487994_101035 [Dolosicoccus paucivorans]
MRYNHRLEIQIQEPVSSYNPKVGRHEVVQEAIYKVVPCHLSPISLERSMQVFGDYKQNILIARCKNKITIKQNEVRIDGQLYKVVRVLQFRGRTVFYLEVAI